jgi:hypothetical protein
MTALHSALARLAHRYSDDPASRGSQWHKTQVWTFHACTRTAAE